MNKHKLKFLMMEFLHIGTICAVVVVNVVVIHCSPLNNNSVDIQGVLGESVAMLCEIDPTHCEKVLWKKKPSVSHLNETSCNNGYCIRHGTEQSVLELPNMSPDNCGSYECWCYHRQLESFLVSRFELTAMCQMKVSLPGDVQIHNGSINSFHEDNKAIEIQPGDSHNVECQNGAEHFTTCGISDDGTFSLEESENECWHLCSLPLNDVSGTCDVRVSLRVHHMYWEPSLLQSDDSLENHHHGRVKRNVANSPSPPTSTAASSYTSTATNTNASTPTIATTVMSNQGSTGVMDPSTINGTTASNPQDDMSDTTEKASSTNNMMSTQSSERVTNLQNITMKASPTTQTKEATAETLENNTITETKTVKTITSELPSATNTTDTEASISTDKAKSSNSSMLTSFPHSHSTTPESCFFDFLSLSGLIAVVSFVISLMALMIATACCCYAWFTLRHMGTATINSTVAGKEEDIALAAVAVKEKSSDSEDLEKGNEQQNGENASPVEPKVTTLVMEPTTFSSPKPTMSSENSAAPQPASALETVAAPVPLEFRETQETPCSTPGTGDDPAEENHVDEENVKPDVHKTMEGTDQAPSNGNETAVTGHQMVMDEGCSELL